MKEDGEETHLENEELIETTIKEVYKNLLEKGYDPISQLKGYLISGDLGYISNYKRSRIKISKLDRNELIEVLIRSYLK